MANAQLGGVLRHLRNVRDTQALVEASDAQLLERFTQRREEAAFTALLRRHGAMVLSVSQRLLHHTQDAEDVFQATFLLLARKAASIRKRESVGSWLHGVAHRLALKLRAQAVRRRLREQHAADQRSPQTRAEAWQEVQTALDAALNELPERYRAALVLCCLEGKTLVQAARILGRPVATVGTQLARGRKLLRARLTKHGLTLSSAGIASLLVASASSAAAPAALTQATVAAALAVAAGQKAAAVCSLQAAELVEKALRTMFFSKTKIALVAVLLGGLVAACTLARVPAGRDETSPNTPAAKPDAIRQAAKEGAVTFSGRVVDLEGAPVASAKVYYYFITREESPLPVRATSDADGRFAFTLTPNDVPLSADAAQRDPLKAGHVIVKADGHTFAWRFAGKGTSDLVFQVARDDTPLEGHIVDLQGKALAGLRISVLGMAAPDKGDLTPFLDALNPREGLYNALAKHLPNHFYNPLVYRHLPRILPTATTDDMGRFRLKGFAKEQLIELRIEGANIETQSLFVLTRTKPAKAEALLTLPQFKAQGEERFARTEQAFVRWNGFDHAAAPGQAVVGTVRDESTKAPIPRAIVESYMLAGTNLAQNTIYHTVADEQGRYRFTGLPRGKGNRIRVRPPKDLPYLPIVTTVPVKDPLVEANVDVDLPRGVWVDVTAKDKATGQPVPGSVSYFILPDKPSPNRFERPFADSYNDFMSIRNDGTFRFVALPRKAILAFRTEWDKYPIAKEAPTVQLPSALSSSNYAAFATIDPKPGAETVKVDFVLDAGGVVKGRVVGPDREPLEGVLVAGLRHDWYTDAGWPPTKKKGEFTALGLDPKHPRLLCFADWNKKLAGSVVLRGDEREQVTVKLQPWGTVSGRLLDTDGKAIKNATLWFT
jgi:RNA polymerase sigma factor (sigma-70 family)